MIDKKILILVMSSNNPTYVRLEESIKNTWYNLKNDTVEILFYKENPERNQPNVVFNHPNLYLPCEDGYYNCGYKTLLTFEWILENYNFDYIYRSNLGTYVDVNNLIDFLKNKPKTKFYCGIIGTNYNLLNKEVKYTSGSGYFLSKDVVESVVVNKSLWQHSVVDDVALGDLITQLKITIDNSAKRKNICDDEVIYQVGDEIVDYIKDEDLYHIRLRSNDRTKDIQNMIQIYKKND